jgi:hypothetical protein
MPSKKKRPQSGKTAAYCLLRSELPRANASNLEGRKMDCYQDTRPDPPAQVSPRRLSTPLKGQLRSLHADLRKKEIAVWSEIERLEQQIRDRSDLLLVIGNSRADVSSVLTVGDTGWCG